MADLIIRAPDPAADKQALYHLLARTFSRGSGYDGFMSRIRNGYVEKGFYDWETSRIGIIDDDIVTHFGVLNLGLRFGGAVLKTAGIGAVATSSDHRKKGYMSRTVHAALEAARDNGYHVSLLYGIPNYYHRFGYVNAWNEFEYRIKFEALPEKGPRISPKRVVPAMAARLAEMYNEEYSGLDGTAVRPTYPLEKSLYQGTAVYWTDGKGKVSGYMIYRVGDDGLSVWETCGPVDSALSLIRKIAVKTLSRSIRFPDIPYHHPLARRLREMDSDYLSSYRPNGSAMMRTVDLPRTIGDLAPGIAKNLSASHMKRWDGALVLSDGRERVSVSFGGTRIRTSAGDPKGRAERLDAGDHLVRFLIGSGDPAELIRVTGASVSRGGRPLVEALFPDRHPILGVWDHF